MKKTYMQPTADVVEIKIEGLMNIVSNGDNTQNAGGNQGDLGDGDEVLSRGDDFFGF